MEGLSNLFAQHQILICRTPQFSIRDTPWKLPMQGDERQNVEFMSLRGTQEIAASAQWASSQ